MAVEKKKNKTNQIRTDQIKTEPNHDNSPSSPLHSISIFDSLFYYFHSHKSVSESVKQKVTRLISIDQ